MALPTQAFTTVNRPWPVEDPAVRLFLFHHAGGSHLFFRDWNGLFPADWDVVLMEAPGRGIGGGRSEHAGDLHTLVRHFEQQMEPHLQVPYAFFGHSMGGLVATELARRLRASGGTGPCWLGLSAWAADEVRPGGPGRHLLPDEELRSLLDAVGGTPAEILESPVLWRLFSPAIRDDFQLIDGCDPACHAPLEDLPQSLFGGEADALLPCDALVALAGRLPRLTGLHLHPGDHFYLHPRRREVARQITADLTGVLRADAA